MEFEGIWGHYFAIGSEQNGLGVVFFKISPFS
jgi:hypothetical protein